MTKPIIQKSPYMSEWPTMLVSSNNEIWRGFTFCNMRLSAEGFVDLARPALNIEYVRGPMKYRPAGKKNFLQAPLFPQLHPADDEVRCHWLGAQRMQQLFIESETIERLLHQPFRFEAFRKLDEDDPVVHNLLDALNIDVKYGHMSGPLLGETILTALISHLLVSNSKVSSSSSRSAAYKVQFNRLASWIEENIDKNISLSEIASMADVSVRHLCRMFHAETGLTPYKYILNRRVEKAKQIIQSGQHSLSETATIAGFANQAHMADIFRKQLGLSPSHFRNTKHMVAVSRGSHVRIKEND